MLTNLEHLIPPNTFKKQNALYIFWRSVLAKFGGLCRHQRVKSYIFSLNYRLSTFLPSHLIQPTQMSNVNLAENVRELCHYPQLTE